VPAAARSGHARAEPGRPKPWLIAFTRAWGRLLARTLFRFEVVGRENVPASGGVLLAGNHSGLLDGPLVYFTSPRPPVLLAKAEIFVGPWARFFGWLGQVPVHRGQPDRAALRSGLEQLRSGGVLGVFPEGTRGSGTFEQVTHGAAYLALRSGVPVVPIAVVGTAEAWPRSRRTPKLGSRVRVVYGPAVTLDVEGDPRARRTVGLAAEQLRLALVDHLRTTTGESA
jgi:1-acyl-sn-glycerol-3-phosphate acyltransferase